MFTAAETTEADSLHQFGEALASYLDEPTPFRFTGWDEAITRLMRLPANGPKPVVIDEFPFLAKATPALPSLIQRALEPSAQRRNTPVRLLLCGSALSFMGKLLAGSAPLQGGTRTARPDARLPAGEGVLGNYRPSHRGADECHRGRNPRVPTGVRPGRYPGWRRRLRLVGVPHGPQPGPAAVPRGPLHPRFSSSDLTGSTTGRDCHY
jgi:hypothetical protein